MDVLPTSNNADAPAELLPMSGGNGALLPRAHTFGKLREPVQLFRGGIVESP